MSIKPDPFEDLADTLASLVEPSYAASMRLYPPAGEKTWVNHPSPEQDTTQALAELRRQVKNLSQQLAEARELNKKLLALNETANGTEGAPDPERAAEYTVRLLARLLPCNLACVFQYYPTEQRFKLLASGGSSAGLVPGNFLPDTNQRIISLALHNQRIVSSSDLPEAGPGLILSGQRFSSLLAAPLVRDGALYGLILLADSSENAFRSASLPIIEATSSRLMNAWEYATQNETLTEFVQSISMMSVVQEMPSLLEMTASIARQSLDASFVIAASLHQQEWLIRSAGRAPRLMHSLQKIAAPFLEQAAKSPYTFRLQDVRADERTRSIQIDTPELRTLLASPIRISGSATGVLLAFGKISGKQFTDTDVFLTELLASQTAVNLESCYLNHELRSNLKTTQLLYDLSLSITKAENLQDAARAIARTAYRLLQARKCGLMLFSVDGRTEAEVHFPSDDPAIHHPSGLIQQAMDSRQTIYLAEAEAMSQIAIPIQTMRRCYGALWMEISDDNEESRHPTEEIRILVNQAAVALERSILLEETRFQANEITRSYHRLEAAYEDLLYGLTKALDARDGETEKHSWRVEDLSVRLGMDMGLSRSELQALKRGALLHDIGKIGVPDSILRKRGPLDDEEWVEMRQHPQKGAQIIQEIPALQDALPIIAFHQERWDGSGYPLHLRGVDIPLLARIFAVVDVFDALTTDRPYRKAISVDDALAYLENQAGILFDPDVVISFVHLVRTLNPETPESNSPAG